MSVYQSSINKMIKSLLLDYESNFILNKKDIGKVSVVDLMILEYIKDNDNVILNNLFSFIPIKRAKMQSIVKKLILSGYIVRKENPDDKRYNLLELDKKGLKILENYYQSEEKFLNFILKDMTINEEKAVVKFLSKIQQSKFSTYL